MNQWLPPGQPLLRNFKESDGKAEDGLTPWGHRRKRLWLSGLFFL